MPTFKVKDLMINVVDARLQLRGGAGYCTAEQPTQLVCTIHSPVMSAVRISDRLERLTKVAALGRDESLAGLKDAAGELANAVVGGALQGGGGVAMPDPNCGGTSMETIPTPITPIVLTADLIKVTDLPVLKERLRATLAAVEKLEAQFAPREGLEREVVAEHLEAAAHSLRGK